MKKFIVFENDNFVDVEKIVMVQAGRVGSTVYFDQIGGGEFCPSIRIEETPSEVRDLIKKALENDVSFTFSPDNLRQDLPL